MNGLAKNIFQKDITYYSKYQEFSGIFKMNDHISDNSIQISIKFTFTVYEFINVDEYILLSLFLYAYWIYWTILIIRNSLSNCELDLSYQ